MLFDRRNARWCRLVGMIIKVVAQAAMGLGWSSAMVIQDPDSFGGGPKAGGPLLWILKIDGWVESLTLLEASGSDTARVMTLVGIAPLPLLAEGTQDRMGWDEPDAEQAQSLCIQAASSDVWLKGGRPASGVVSAASLQDIALGLDDPTRAMRGRRSIRPGSPDGSKAMPDQGCAPKHGCVESLLRRSPGHGRRCGHSRRSPGQWHCWSGSHAARHH